MATPAQLETALRTLATVVADVATRAGHTEHRDLPARIGRHLGDAQSAAGPATTTPRSVTEAGPPATETPPRFGPPGDPKKGYVPPDEVTGQRTVDAPDGRGSVS